MKQITKVIQHRKEIYFPYNFFLIYGFHQTHSFSRNLESKLISHNNSLDPTTFECKRKICIILSPTGAQHELNHDL